MKRVFGIPVVLDDTLNGDKLSEMTEDEKLSLLERIGFDEVEQYTIDGWFNYLNNEMIDTENFWWIVV